MFWQCVPSLRRIFTNQKLCAHCGPGPSRFQRWVNRTQPQFQVKQNESLYLFHSTVIDSCDQPAFLCWSFWSTCSLLVSFFAWMLPPVAFVPATCYRHNFNSTPALRLFLLDNSYCPFLYFTCLFSYKAVRYVGFISFYFILIRVISSSKRVLKDTISSEKEKKGQKKDLIVWSSFLWWVTLTFSRGNSQDILCLVWSFLRSKWRRLDLTPTLHKLDTCPWDTPNIFFSLCIRLLPHSEATSMDPAPTF